jgi:predicted lipid-binding transport protein (Tim44 family)
MKKFLSMFAAAFLAFGLMTLDAEAAKRLGGGKSVGAQRSSVSPNSATPPSKAAPVQNAAPAAAPAPKPAGNRWMGMLGGIAAGLGLAYLLSHFGLGDMAGTILMVILAGVAALLIFGWLARRKAEGGTQQGSMQYAGISGMQPGAGPIAAPPAAPAIAMGSAASAAAPVQPSIPVGFDTDGFLRQAKLSFVKMQAAHDSGRLDEIREFTTDEMFEALKLEIPAGGGGQTDVVTLNADLLEVSTEGNSHWASVRFSGMIREDAGSQPESFQEVWNLAKPVSGASGWVLAGIQQMQ